MAGPRRVTIDLTDDASDEIDRIREETGLSIADIFRHSFTMFRLYLEAKSQKKDLRIIDPAKPNEQVRIEFPIIGGSSRSRRQSRQEAVTESAK